MFITNDRSGYRGTSQYGSGMFLMVFCNSNAPKRIINGKEQKDLRCLVRKVAMHQCGHFMMGHSTLMGHRFSLSGTYGSDGLPIEITEYKAVKRDADGYGTHWADVEKVPGLWERLHPLPDDLVEVYWTGGGSAGSEGPLLRAWARENLIKLRHFAPVPVQTYDLNGYVYEYQGKRNWKGSRDERWETVCVTAYNVHKIGERRIDGSLVHVFRSDESIYACSPQGALKNEVKR